MMHPSKHQRHNGGFRAATAAIAVALALVAAGCSSGSKSASHTTDAPHHSSAHEKSHDSSPLTTDDTDALSTDQGSDTGDLGSGGDDTSVVQSAAVANDAELATPAGYSPDTANSSQQQQAFVKSDDNSEIWWPGCTYPGTTDTAASATQCLNQFGQMAKLGDPDPETFGGVKGTLQEGETSQTADAPVPLYVVAACLPTYGQHVACAVLATPATGGSIPDAEASAFLDAVNGLAGYTGKS